MAQYKPPQQLNFVDPNWDRFITQYETFRLLTELDKKPGKIQVASLKYCMGPESEEVMKTFNLTEDQAKDYDTVKEKFKNYFSPRKNVLRFRRIFYRRAQQPHEDTEVYLRALYAASEYCDFGDRKERIRDQFVAGISNEDLAEKIELLYYSKDGVLTLDDVIEYARTYNDVHEGRKQEKEQNKNIEEVKAGRSGFSKKGSTRNTGTVKNCNFCGRSHIPRKCPAYGKVCNKCKKWNHFAAMCKSVGNKVDEVAKGSQIDSESDGEEQLGAQAFLGEVAVEAESGSEPLRVKVKMGDQDVQFKVDTGADVSTISYRTYLNLRTGLGLQHLDKADLRLTSPAGPLGVIGMFSSWMEYKGKTRYEKVYVLSRKSKSENLLSRGAALKMHIIVFVGNLEIEQSVFGFGQWKTEPVSLCVKEDAVPFRVRCARSVAIPLMSAVKENLCKLEKADVIEKVSHPTEWVSPMVPVVKPKAVPLEVRLCVDYRALNKYLKREIFEIPTFDEVVSKFSGAVYFSKLDAKSGFYQIPLDERSRDLTTFITPLGRYRFKRLPMGICVAPEIFQRKMMELLEGLPGVECFLDDIVVSGSSEEEHDKNLGKVLGVIKQAGLKLNREKCVFKQKEIEFLGHTIGEEGVKINPAKVKAILDLERPGDVPQLRRLLGMVNFLARFLPRLQDIIQPLTLLLSTKNAWVWEQDQERSFQALKRILTSAPVLCYFDPSKPTKVSADASSYGLGGVLLQRHQNIWKPVAFCSRLLSESEQKWAQIEKECLAATWACERFKQFVTGVGFVLETDHKPLIPLINSKELHLAPVRCQRMLMKLARFSLVAEYTPGKFMVVADALSRSPMGLCEQKEESLEEEVEGFVGGVVGSLPVSSNQLQRIKEEQAKDKDLSLVSEYVLNGWPEVIGNDDGLSKYWAARGYLSVVDGGLLLYNDRLVIPESLRKEMLIRIHSEGHLCLGKCRRRAHDSVWWPNLGPDLKGWIDNCSFCLRHSRQQRAEPLKPTVLPERPWLKIGADLCSYKGSEFLIVVDYYSRWIEIVYLEETTSSYVIGKLKNIFAKFGIPEVLISDNGPQFGSTAFQKFSVDYGFQHCTSDPHFPQENGCAERAVQTAKRLLSQDDVFLALMVYRASPLDTTGCSPAQLLMGRQIRTRLPMVKSKLLPRWPDLQRVAETDARMKTSSAFNYNRRHGARLLQPLKEETPVFLKSYRTNKWEGDSTRVGSQVGDRSYLVRNRRHLKALPTSVGNTAGSVMRDLQQERLEQIPLSPGGQEEDPGGALGTRMEGACQEVEKGKLQYITRSGRCSKPPSRLDL